jgi:myo-inositol-1(or 4)-monophosphatase
VDAAAEAAVVARLERVPAGFTLVSEELGRRVFGDGGDGVTVVCDPIDGSLNAKRGIPFFSLSLAVASGPAMEDVELGFVHDFGTGEEWVARRGEGAFLNGRLLEGPPPKERIEILSLEATRTDLVAEHVAAMVGFAVHAGDGLAGALPLPPRRGPRRAVVSLKPRGRGHCRRAAPRRDAA